MCTPIRRSRSAVAGPTPGIDGDRHRVEQRPFVTGWPTTTSPSGLSRSLAILATSFEVAMPTDPVRPPVTSWIRSLSRSATAVTVGDGVAGELGGGEVDERLVERQRLDER